jgi:hypothetical protein
MGPSRSQVAGEPKHDRVTVDVAMPRNRAIDRTMQAFIADIATVLSLTGPPRGWL